MLVFGCAEPQKPDMVASQLRCEYLQDPMGIDAVNPRLSWILEGTKKAQAQSKYRIIVSSNSELIGKDIGDLWESGEIESSESVNVRYNGSALHSGVKCYWKVKVWDQDSVESDWSGVHSWSMGLLDSTDWKADWIGYDAAWQDSTIQTKPYANGIKTNHQYKPLPCPYLRKEFTIEQPFESATCYVTALGLYELYINGERVGVDHFSPGWSDYGQRIYYQTYDIGPLLQTGENSIAAILADGWYAGNVANRGQYKYGKHLRLKAQVETKHEGKSSVVVLTDGDWKASYGPIREADMQGGETHDRRLEMTGWSNLEFDDSGWTHVVVDDTLTAPLQSYPSETVRRFQEITPVSVFETKPGVYIADMGQNFAGWARLNVKGKSGDSIVLRFGEKLHADSSLLVRNLRTARSTDTYVMRGDHSETWEPKFTYHGYQYVEISGYNGAFTANNITGIVLHSNLSESGTFDCSDGLVNQIHQNILWSQRSNFFEVPTDCPQRDERLGWTGDAHLFLPTAAYNMDVAAFYSKWLVAVRDGQFENGQLPSNAPRVYRRVAAGWGDAGVICPWDMRNLYNDQKILADSYESMVRWVNYLEHKQEGLINKQLTYGDWQNANSETPLYLISAAYFKHSVDLLAKASSALGKVSDVEKYNQLSSDIKKAFIDEFVSDSARVMGNTQTGYLMAISFDLLPDSLVELAQSRLVELIVENDYRLTTGILGTRLLLPTLTKIGEVDMAYRLLQSRDYPSWGFQIENGANTIWERWDSYSERAGFHKDSTNSLNHFALGSIGEWFYSTIGGIKNLESGYKVFEIRPRIGGGLTHAKASYASIRGTIVSDWVYDETGFTLSVSIPVNTTSVVYLPMLESTDIDQVKEKAVAEGAVILEQTDQEMILDVPSGQYIFRVPRS